MAENNNLQDMIRTSLESIKTMIDADTVVGNPINTPAGTTIIPISKVSVGFASGGTDFGGKTSAKNFAGGGGTGLTVQPVCFISVNAEGVAEVLHVGEKGERSSAETIAELIEKAPGLIDRIKTYFANKQRKKDLADLTDEELADAMAEEAEQAVADENEE